MIPSELTCRVTLRSGAQYGDSTPPCTRHPHLKCPLHPQPVSPTPTASPPAPSSILPTTRQLRVCFLVFLFCLFCFFNSTCDRDHTPVVSLICFTWLHTLEFRPCRGKRDVSVLSGVCVMFHCVYTARHLFWLLP